MKKFLIASTALVALSTAAAAADLPTRAAAPAPVYSAPVFTWSGFYVGVTGGYADGKSTYVPEGVLLGSPAGTMHPKGGLIGGQVGYNHQYANGLVLGVVADLSWADLKGKHCAEARNPCEAGDPTDSWAHGKVNMFGTVRAKAGFAVSSGLLVYATGGVAMTHGEVKVVGVPVTGEQISGKGYQYGWTVGAGAEYKLSDAWSVNAEYLYANLGHKTYGLSGGIPAGLAAARADLTMNVVRLGLNYKFGGPAPVVAKY